jgi:hypothetical protein
VYRARYVAVGSAASARRALESGSCCGLRRKRVLLRHTCTTARSRHAFRGEHEECSRRRPAWRQEQAASGSARPAAGQGSSVAPSLISQPRSRVRQGCSSFHSCRTPLARARESVRLVCFSTASTLRSTAHCNSCRVGNCCDTRLTTTQAHSDSTPVATTAGADVTLRRTLLVSTDSPRAVPLASQAPPPQQLTHGCQLMTQASSTLTPKATGAGPWL